ncbi:MAG: dTDP-4-dehydrorhamnose 3,5-epimerase [Methanospirillaceae archaeon]|nr:dTDP-4-dehydrorhamnose 3,5-epimerase [Methanospirillaceae archaeon]
MRIERGSLEGAAIIHAEPFIDNRGAFARFFCENELGDLLGKRRIVNVNFSRTSQEGAIRGLHFQYPPKAEMKMVRCIRGSVFDVIVDIRKGSPSFLKWTGIELSAENMQMLCIPEGFAHGFQVLKESSEMLYLHCEFYSRDLEGGLRYCDPDLDIRWPLEPTDISERDREHPLVSDGFKGVIV